MEISENPVDSHVKENIYISNRKRRSWYLSTKGGYGFGNLSAHDKSAVSTDKDKSRSGFTANYEAGIKIRSNLLLGAFTGGFAYEQHEDDFTITRSIIRFGLAATYFPEDKNYFARAGLEFGQYGYNLEDVHADELLEEYNRKGVGGHIGVGYAVWIKNNINVTLSGEIIGYTFGSDSQSIRTQFSLGLMWY